MHTHTGLGLMHAASQTRTPPTHSMSTTHQARWVGELTGETTHSLMTHLLMLIIRLTRLTYVMALALFLQRRETRDKDTTYYLTSDGRQGHSLPQGHPPPTTSKLPLQTNSVLSIVMSTSSKETLTRKSSMKQAPG